MSTVGHASHTGKSAGIISGCIGYYRRGARITTENSVLDILSFGGEPSKQFFERLRYYRRHKRLTPYSSQAHQNGMNVSMLLSAVLCSQESFGVLKC